MWCIYNTFVRFICEAYTKHSSLYRMFSYNIFAWYLSWALIAQLVERSLLDRSIRSSYLWVIEFFFFSFLFSIDRNEFVGSCAMQFFHANFFLFKLNGKKNYCTTFFWILMYDRKWVCFSCVKQFFHANFFLKNIYMTDRSWVRFFLCDAIFHKEIFFIPVEWKKKTRLFNLIIYFIYLFLNILVRRRTHLFLR